ncbi:MAG TPA: hypothetical protein VGP88_06375 [Thermoplasmata archaeon]|jgi:hypothetical protein|nr:hypothetical protein [Thermoplasmata archaeon]
MRLHKVVNRKYQGTVYYRWVLSVPPKSVRELGWVDGQELEVTVRGSVLSISPALHLRTGRPGWQPGSLEEGIQRKSVGRR